MHPVDTAASPCRLRATWVAGGQRSRPQFFTGLSGLGGFSGRRQGCGIERASLSPGRCHRGAGTLPFRPGERPYPRGAQHASLTQRQSRSAAQADPTRQAAASRDQPSADRCDRRPDPSLPAPDGRDPSPHPCPRGLPLPGDRDLAATVSPHDARQRFHPLGGCAAPRAGAGGHLAARPHHRSLGDQHPREEAAAQAAWPEPRDAQADRAGKGPALPDRDVAKQATRPAAGGLAAARAAAEQGRAARRGAPPSDPAALPAAPATPDHGGAVRRRRPSAADAGLEDRRAAAAAVRARAATDIADNAGEPDDARAAACEARGFPAAVRRRQAGSCGRQLEARDLDRQAVSQPRPDLPRSHPGRQLWADAGRRQVRTRPRVQVLDLRHLVDPAGHHPGDRRPEPHDPRAGAHGRRDDADAESAAAAAPGIRPRGHGRGTRGAVGTHGRGGGVHLPNVAAARIARPTAWRNRRGRGG